MKTAIKNLPFRNKNWLKKTMLIAWFSLLLNIANAQTNLVPNPSFEKYDTCPNSYNQLQYAYPWDTLKNGGGAAPDLMVACSLLPSNIGVPKSGVSFQYPRSGNAYSNASFYWNAHYFNEYIQVPLKDSLIIGKVYCITFYLNLTDRSKYAIDQIGAYFDDGSISTCWCCPAIVNPQVKSPIGVYLQDTTNWMKIQGSFTAQGNESYLTIGNFRADSNTNVIVSGSSWFNYGLVAEYLIDDVSVMESSATIQADNDTTILKGDTITLGKSIEGMPIDWYDIQGNLLAASSTINVHPTTTTSYVVKMDLCGNVSYDTVTVSVSTGVEQLVNDNEKLVVYPNPVSQSIVISHQSLVNTIEITDVLGRVVFQQIKNSLTQQIQIDVSSLSNGIYFIKAIDKNGNVMNAKFVKE
ncbi:MAG: hypothetical protein RL708_407 [Bacteroidota bacterium]|jgi:hypothetical protein